MADAKITALTALTVVETGDLLPVVDVDDTTDDAAGTTKKILVSHVVGGVPGMNIETLSADRDLYANTDYINQVFLGTYTVTLKNAGAVAGNIFRIKCNKPYNQTAYLSVFFEGLGTVDYISAQSTKTYIFNGTNWVAGGLGAGDDTSSGYNNIAIGGKSVAANGAIAIGPNSSAAGNSDAVAIGRGATSQGGAAAISLGQGATSDDYAIAIGRSAYTGAARGISIGDYSTSSNYGIAIGVDTTNNALAHAISLGRGSYAERKFELTRNTNAGDQYGYNYRQSDVAWGTETTDATETEVFLGQIANARCVLSSIDGAVAMTFKLLAVARENATDDCKGWEISGVIKRTAAGATALVGTVTSTVLGADAGASAWTITVTADDTNNSLKVTVTGEASHTIKWNIRGQLIEVAIN